MGARILIIASGSGIDVACTAPALEDRRFEIVLNDFDPEALVAAAQRLAALGPGLTFRQADTFHLLRRPAELGAFDLVLAGVWFDYLSDRQAVLLIKTVLRSLLKPGGGFCFTNMARGNLYRGGWGIWRTGGSPSAARGESSA